MMNQFGKPETETPLYATAPSCHASASGLPPSPWIGNGAFVMPSSKPVAKTIASNSRSAPSFVAMPDSRIDSIGSVTSSTLSRSNVGPVVVRDEDALAAELERRRELCAQLGVLHLCLEVLERHALADFCEAWRVEEHDRPEHLAEPILESAAETERERMAREELARLRRSTPCPSWERPTRASAGTP
jgi:hypothetical protein